ncbi:MAG: hypothetical protein H6981_00815 [Gammaproteobacteria bacterium]|nr:hypothetical protein [Gammaproteobacteria bacterium]MCP5135329.1 hypothetical protein [Gammaproteobacteria bacterium]
MPQHESHLVQIANFTFSAMIGVLALLIVGFLLSEHEVRLINGVPNVPSLVMPMRVLGVLAIISTLSRLVLLATGQITEHWLQNQVQFLIGMVLSIYFLITWLIF